MGKSYVNQASMNKSEGKQANQTESLQHLFSLENFLIHPKQHFIFIISDILLIEGGPCEPGYPRKLTKIQDANEIRVNLAWNAQEFCTLLILAENVANCFLIVAFDKL